MSPQLDLFGHSHPERPTGGADPAAEALDAVHREAANLAQRISPRIRLGTSSWSFPGWKGIVYSAGATETSLAREGLREYARHPLLRTVGIDRSYYAPIPDEDLRRYAAQLPEGFLACAKAPALVTSAEQPGREGGANPEFMSARRLVEDLLMPFERSFAAFTGPFILEFPPIRAAAGIDGRQFVRQLDRFLGGLPPRFRYGVELRNRQFLTPDYARVLATHGAGHVYNYWSAMPMPGDQAAVVAPESLPFAVVRLLLAPGTWYDDQRARFRPFNRIVAEDQTMRAQTVSIARRVAAMDRDALLLVNNKAEGSSPLTVMGLARLLADATG
jgi:uncharacterized protein YecE (DUF72 family)